MHSDGPGDDAVDSSAPPTPAGRELDATSPATAQIQDAIASSLGALLADKDISELASLEGSFVEARRRGRRERLDVVIEGPLFALLRDAGAERGVVRMRATPRGSAGGPPAEGNTNTSSHDVIAGPLADGRIALRVVKTSAPDATFDSLVEEGVLPLGIDVELRAAVLEGGGVIIAGPARAARRRTVAALVRSLADKVSFFGATDSLASLVSVPLARGAPVVDKAKAAAALGCDVIAALDIAPRTALALARAELGVPFVVSIAASSMDAIRAAFDDARLPVAAFADTTAIIGHAPDGAARLAELHGPTRAEHAAPPTPPNAAASRPSNATMASRGLPAASAGSAGAPAEVSGLRARPSFAASRAPSQEGAPVDDDLPPLDNLPAAWASESPDDDPGWELGEPPPAGGDEPSATSSGASGAPTKGSFDAALAAQKGKPSFAPRAPKPHPQAAALRGDPFGGLTLEPPPGGPALADDGDDEEPR